MSKLTDLKSGRPSICSFGVSSLKISESMVQLASSKMTSYCGWIDVRAFLKIAGSSTSFLLSPGKILMSAIARERFAELYFPVGNLTRMVRGLILKEPRMLSLCSSLVTFFLHSAKRTSYRL